MTSTKPGAAAFLPPPRPPPTVPTEEESEASVIFKVVLVDIRVKNACMRTGMSSTKHRNIPPHNPLSPSTTHRAPPPPLLLRRHRPQQQRRTACARAPDHAALRGGARAPAAPLPGGQTPAAAPRPARLFLGEGRCFVGVCVRGVGLGVLGESSQVDACTAPFSRISQACQKRRGK